MLKTGLVLILILSAGKGYAQQDYFVLINADDHQPFYALIGGKSFGSSAQGHLILSQLKDGDYTIRIGSPSKQFPEQQFSFPVQQKDLEFQFKDLGDKGWGLFNPQSLELKMPDKKEEPAAGAGPESVKKDNAFARLMAGVVSDTAVMYNTYAMEKVLTDTPVTVAPNKGGVAEQPVPQMDTTHAAVAVTTMPDSAQVDTIKKFALKEVTDPHPAQPTLTGRAAAPPVTTEPMRSSPVADTATAGMIVKEPLYRSVDSTKVITTPLPVHRAGNIVKLSERKTDKNWRGVYTDRAAGRKTDTVVVIIPLDTTIMAKAPVRPEQKEVLIKPDTAKLPAGANTSASGQLAPGQGAGGLAPAGPKTGKLVVANSDCKNFASDYDVDKLRVRMLEGGKDEERIGTARKVFKTRCFTTRQIKALSEVFTTDAAKYRFFETAYPFVSDEHFSELASLLADPVYNSKFKAMTGQP